MGVWNGGRKPPASLGLLGNSAPKRRCHPPPHYAWCFEGDNILSKGKARHFEGWRYVRLRKFWNTAHLTRPTATQTHRRPPRSPVWVFGMVDVSHQPALGYLEIVPQRDAATLLPIIQTHSNPGTEIWSDEWWAYQQVQTLTNNYPQKCKILFVSRRKMSHANIRLNIPPTFTSKDSPPTILPPMT